MLNKLLKRDTLDRDAYKQLTTGDLDDLPYGIIVVDPTGVIVGYNRAEAKKAGFARERVMGRNFFSEVAPCTIRNVRGSESELRRTLRIRLPVRERAATRLHPLLSRSHSPRSDLDYRPS
jgi:PAS domain-containing protein